MPEPGIRAYDPLGHPEDIGMFESPTPLSQGKPDLFAMLMDVFARMGTRPGIAGGMPFPFRPASGKPLAGNLPVDWPLALPEESEVMRQMRLGQVLQRQTSELIQGPMPRGQRRPFRVRSEEDLPGLPQIATQVRVDPQTGERIEGGRVAPIFGLKSEAWFPKGVSKLRRTEILDYLRRHGLWP